jgi:hypothetical protein
MFSYIGVMYELPSLNCGHCLVDTKCFGINIAHFIVVGKTRSSVFWCGACFGAGIRLAEQAPTSMNTQYQQTPTTSRLHENFISFWKGIRKYQFPALLTRQYTCHKRNHSPRLSTHHHGAPRDVHTFPSPSLRAPPQDLGARPL